MATSIIVLDRLQCLDWVAMNKKISAGCVPYDFVEGIVQINIAGLLVTVAYHRDRSALFWNDANGLAVQLFQSLDKLIIPFEISLLLALRPWVM